MSLALPRRISAPAINSLPLSIGTFCMIWSFAFVAGKVGVADCPPLILLAVRFLLAGVLILGWSFARREASRLSARDIGVFAILGVANNALYLGLGYTALQTVSAGLGGLIISTNPVFTAILAAMFLGEALTWRKIAGLALGVAGVAVIVSHRLSVGSDSLTGILLTLASLASLVAGTLLFRFLAPKGDLWLGNGVQNLAAGLALAPIASMGSSLGEIVPSLRLLAAFAFLVFLGSMLGFRLWFHLLAVCGATVASSFHFLIPPLAMLFAWLVLGERIVGFDLLGIVPVALGIYLVTRPAVGAVSAGGCVEGRAR